MTLFDQIELLRTHDGAQLERKTAQVLSAFLSGYAIGRSDLEFKSDEQFLDAFNAWVARKFKCFEGQGWAKIIEFHSASETDEWKLFWRLYDEYKAKANDKRVERKKHSA